MAASRDEIVSRIREERNLLLVERERLYRLALAVEARGKKVDQKLSDCVAAGRLFEAGLVIPDWVKVLKTSLEEEMSKLMTNGVWVKPEPHVASDDEEFLKAILEEGGEPEGTELRPSDMPSICEIVLSRLEAAAEKGVKASAIREYIETTYAAQIHVKTVGMTLYRLEKKEGLARRDGRLWFYVTPQAKSDDAASKPDDAVAKSSGDGADQNKGSDT